MASGEITFITKDFECFTSFSIEIDAESGQKATLIGEVGINPESPDERYTDLRYTIQPVIMDIFGTISVNTFEDVIACFTDD